MVRETRKLADMYNSYYNSIKDKEFAKQPAFWLSAKKYLMRNLEQKKILELLIETKQL